MVGTHTLSFLAVLLFALSLCGSAFAVEQAVCVQSHNAQLRKGPGTEFPVSWTVGQLMPFMKIGEQGQWTQVKDMDGQVHWIASRLLTTRYACAVVKTKTAKLKTAPGARAPASEREMVDRYTPFKKIDREGEWVQVQDDHQTEYWINDTNLWAPVVKSELRF